MKARYYISIILLMPILLYSCAAPYQISTNTKLNYDWIVSSADVEGDLAGVQITAPVFEDASLQCLVGSKWSFLEGGSGSYTINSSDSTSCIRGIRKLTWEVITLKKAHYLQFYRVTAPKGILTDRFTLYVAELSDLSKKAMVLKYPIKYQGKTGNIVFTLNVK